MAARTPGRILPAAHPQTELTTTITVPFCCTAWSTSPAVRASAIPAEVNSWRIGAIIISGYILCSSQKDFSRGSTAFGSCLKAKGQELKAKSQEPTAYFAKAFPASNVSCKLCVRLNIQQNIPLAPLTTLQVGGPARYFVEARTECDVQDALAYARERSLPLFVLGDGSNLVVADTGWPGLVLKVSVPGVEFAGDGDSV